MVTGKLGNIVGMKGRNGRSNARMRVTPKNPKTLQQSIQRVIFGSVTKAYSLLKSVTDHSFEGISYGQPSQEYFMKRNLARYRDFFAQWYGKDMSGLSLKDDIAYCGGSQFWDCGVGAEISRGSLPSILPNGGVASKITSFGAALTADTNIATVLSANNLEKGDQITVVIMAWSESNPPQIFKSRYVTDSAAEDSAFNTGWNAAGTGDAYDAERTIVGAARLNATSAGLVPVLVGHDDLVIAGAAVIISRKVGSEWQRSNAILYNMGDEYPTEAPEVAVTKYMAGGATINTTSDRYLNNADSLGE